METKERHRRPAGDRKAPARKKTATQSTARPRAKAAPQAKPERKAAPASASRRRKTGAPTTPNRAERQRATARRRAKAQPRPEQRRTVLPPREDIPAVVYTPAKPLRRGRFALKLVSMVAVVVAIFFGLSLFFRVETIAVAGADKYTPWMIRQASGIGVGDSLLSISEARVASRIISNLPYVDRVKVGIQLPGTVEIQLTELQVTYAVESETGQWWLISANGRAVEQVPFDKALGYTRVEGLRIRAPQQGNPVQALPGQVIDPDEGTAESQSQADADEQLAALVAVMTALEESRIIGQVTVINVTDVYNMMLEFPSLLTVRLGDGDRMAYKMGFVASALEQLGDTPGELDISLELSNDGVFTPAG